MREPEVIKAYQRKKNNEYAKSKGFTDWDDLVANSKWTKKNEQ
jgi:hypothetical protein